MQSHLDAEFLALTKHRGETYALFARLLGREIAPQLLHLLRTLREPSLDRVTAGEGQLLLDRYFAAIEPLDENRVIVELAADFAGLFLNAGSRPVHPYESVYSSPERLLMQKARDQVRQSYAAAGLKPSAQSREPEDHIAFEMDFMNRLCARTVEDFEKRREDAVQACLQSQREFLRHHLLRWAPQFCRDLIRNAATDFYRALGCLIRDFLELERDLIAEE